MDVFVNGRARGNVGYWFFVGALAGIVALPIAAPHALATQPPASCENVNYNVQAEQETNQGDHQGIKTELWFANYNDDCNRISGVHVLYGNGYVEWSWVLGYSACNGNYYTSPTLFRNWKPNNGSTSCAVHFGNTQGTFFTVMLKDENSNTEWGAYKEGTLIGSVMNVNFDRGTIGTNGERDSTQDSAYSHFKELKYQVVGDSNFKYWSYAGHQYDNDPGFRNKFNSNTDVEVVKE